MSLVAGRVVIYWNKFFVHAVSYKGEDLQRTLKQTCIFLFITIADTKIEGSASLLLKWAKTFNIPKGGLEMGSVNS